MKRSAIFLISFLLAASFCQAQQLFPNDPYFKNQISFYNKGGDFTFDLNNYRSKPVTISTTARLDHKLPEAWSISTGSKDVIVAIIDDGFFYQHEDIRENIWNNNGESGIDENGYDKRTNGVDDDNNGYVDDYVGYDFIFRDPDPDAYIFNGRDTTVIAIYVHSIPAMGIIGARGNNGIGVAGINWNVSMMLLKTGAQGDLFEKDYSKQIDICAEAIRYAVDNGARVINWSGFVGEKDLSKLQPLKEAFDYAEENGVLIVLAAGNSLHDMDKPENRFYPQSFNNSNVFRVGEIDFNGKMFVVDERDPIYIGGSNYGIKTVHIAAFAQNYSTTMRYNLSAYRLTGGTSNSGPVAAGVAALMLSVNPKLKAKDLIKIMVDTATPIPDLKDKFISGGMLNAYLAVKTAKEIRK